MTIKKAVCTAKARCIDNFGKMTITGGTFTSTNTGINTLMGNSDSSTVITGGTFTAKGAAVYPETFKYNGDCQPYAVLCGYNASMSIRGGKFSCPKKPQDKGVIGVSYGAKSFTCEVNVNITKPA